jgi:hypothetical protein
MVKEFLDAGLWDVDRARAAFADLDVESEQTLENSILRLFVDIAEDCLYEGKPRRPNEMHVGSYEICIKTAQVYLAMAETEKVSARNIGLYQRYLDELAALKATADAKKAPPAQPPAPANDNGQPQPTAQPAAA